MRPLILIDELKQELGNRGIKFLYHANSFQTAITYFRHGSMFTRERCEIDASPQSGQWSDDLDKEHEIGVVAHEVAKQTFKDGQGGQMTRKD